MTITTLDLFAWLGFAVLLWVAREMGLGLWAWRKSRRFDHVLKVERTRGQFATIRNKLASLAVEDRLDPCSVTFNRLYLVNTVFMRSPDRYPALSQTIHQTIMDSKNERASPALWRESKKWTPEVRQVVIQTADAMQQVLIGYSWLFRVYYGFANKKAQIERKKAKFKYQVGWSQVERMMQAFRAIAQEVIIRVESRDEAVVEIRKAQSVMYRMAQ